MVWAFSNGTAQARPKITQVEPSSLAFDLQTAAEQRRQPGLLRMRINSGIRIHELVLNPNRSLGPEAERLRGRAATYEGHLLGLPASWVRLTRMPEGWVGLWFDGQQFFGLDRAAAFADSTEPTSIRISQVPGSTPVVFRIADVEAGSVSFVGDIRHPPGLSSAESNLGPVDFSAEIRPPTAFVLLPTKRLNVALVADAELAAREGVNTEGAMLARLNVADGVFADQLGVRLSAASSTIFDAATQPFSGNDASALLDQLAAYRLGSTTQRASGVSHLMTGRDLTNNTVGIAFIGSVCRNNFGAALSEARNEAAFDGLIAAHEMGHVFGAPHDAESGSDCQSTPDTFLMAPQLNRSRTFSACSLEKIAPVLSAATCLVTIDAADVTPQAPASADLFANLSSTFSLSVRSVGNVAAQNVVLSISLPATLGVSAASGSAPGVTCTRQNLELRCPLGSLNAGTTTTVQVQVTAAQLGNGNAGLTLTADNDGLPSNNSASIQLRVQEGADLAVTTSLDRTTIEIGADAVATINMQNLGPLTANDARLSLTLPTSLALQSATATGLSCTTSGNTVDCAPFVLAATATARLVVTLRGTTAGNAALTAAITSSRGDSQMGNNQAQATLTVNAPAPPPTPTPPPAGNSSGGGGSAGVFSLFLLLMTLVAQRRNHGVAKYLFRY